MKHRYPSWLALVGLAAIACEHDAGLGFACPGPSSSCVLLAAADSGSAAPGEPGSALDGGTVPSGASPASDSGTTLPTEQRAAADGGMRPTQGAGAEPAQTNCQRFSVGQYVACGNVGTAGAMPQLKAAQPHTLHVHSNLAAAGSMQVVAVGENCLQNEPVGSFSLPTGPADQTVCLTAQRDSATLMITVTSGGSAAFLTNQDSYVELCAGCQ